VVEFSSGVGFDLDLHWRVVPECRLLWSDWGEITSVFSSLTGETHLLSALPAEAISAIACGPITVGDLSALLARQCSVADSPSWRAKIIFILKELASLDLVEVTPREGR
jgi:hypothetical protein